ncbi:TetR/AcrR family transcriptional regulator [Leifsonia sp. TF02-11]|uniref:TetR/AcrR family transcriptional regulator n=1 Tax=Leifsonia sp. TF02-11 TaxID=2815212 RepID=UPI001AA0BDED|nr:TetR/AcrR family transcriptional regulator [Leifsonia sp. TF02-11]MBO1741095.1 TetR family transcriptional regulator [Leifsonia sp. TF02-11]
MSTADAAPRRTRSQTTAAIESAAVALVNELGYDAVTVDMICERAEISQRTFFNHFKTKDAAVIGSAGPVVDQQFAREFIVAHDPLLPDAFRLVVLPQVAAPEQVAARIRAVGSHPELMARQMQRFTLIEAEITDILRLRLLNENPGADESTRQEQARLLAALLAGLFRYLAESTTRTGGKAPVTPARIAELLRDLGIPLV